MIDASSEVAAFCAHLPELRKQSDIDGFGRELQETEDAIRAAVDPPGDVLDRFWRQLGIPIDSRRGIHLPGQDAAPPPAGDYRCPRKLCSRRVTRAPGAPAPECGLFQARLEFL